jgi:MYXO-CTERM domain-containing protein
VHVYYDTGKTTTVKGQTRPVLEAMVPFGFYLHHDGPLFGFTHALEGMDGAVVTKIAENFYKVRIANEGQIRVKTTITAEEKPKGGTVPGGPPCPPGQVDHGRCHCRAAGVPGQGGLMLSALALGAALLARRNRRKRLEN